MRLQEALRRVWDFLWHDDSIYSWIANVILAFVIIKFVFYPFVGFLMGTPLPVVAVVSNSMEHGTSDGMLCGQAVLPGADYWDTCGEWYAARGISQEEFENYPFSKGFHKGDIMFIIGSNQENTDRGDIIVFQSQKAYPIIHRVTSTREEKGVRIYETKGDNNPIQIREYMIGDGQYFYVCYQEQNGQIIPSLCAPGTKRVTPDIPGAIPVLDETIIYESQVIGKAVGRLPFLGYLKIWFVDILTFLGLGRVSQVF